MFFNWILSAYVWWYYADKYSVCQQMTQVVIVYVIMLATIKVVKHSTGDTALQMRNPYRIRKYYFLYVCYTVIYHAKYC